MHDIHERAIHSTKFKIRNNKIIAQFYIHRNKRIERYLKYPNGTYIEPSENAYVKEGIILNESAEKLNHIWQAAIRTSSIIENERRIRDFCKSQFKTSHEEAP